MNGSIATLARRAAAVMTACILAWAFAPPAAAQLVLPGATDLAATGRDIAADGSPLVVLYSQDNCSWCDKARSQLVPMSRDPKVSARFAQIDIDRSTPLTDFAGQRTSHSRFARDEGIRFTPMLVIYGPSGERLADPVVGMGAVDFYGDMVMKAIDQARQRLRAQRMHSAALQLAPAHRPQDSARP